MLTLKRYATRGPNWYIRGTVRGQAVFETTGTDDRQTAEAIRIKREAQLLERSVFGAGAQVTFLEAAVSYIASGGEHRFLGNEDPATGKWSGLIGRFHATRIADIGQTEIDAAAMALYPNTKPSSRKRMVYVPMCAVLNHAQAKGWGKTPTIQHPRVRNAETKWATPEYVQTLLPHCAPKLALFVLVIVYTGARLAEALRVDWDGDVNLTERTLILRRTKNGKMRAAHIPDDLLVALAAVPPDQRKGRLFHWSDKCHVYGPLRTACRRAGLDYLAPHQLGRHTFGTWLRLYGKRDLKGLMNDGGWDSVQSVLRYAHLVPGETVTAVNSLPSVHQTCTTPQSVDNTLKKKRKSA